MSEKIRTTIYMLRTIHGKAHALMRHLDYSKNLTVFLEQLIREKWDACGGDSALRKYLEPESPPSPDHSRKNSAKGSRRNKRLPIGPSN